MWRLGISVSSHGGFFVVGSGGGQPPGGGGARLPRRTVPEKLPAAQRVDSPWSQEGVQASGSAVRQFSSPQLKG